MRMHGRLIVCAATALLYFGAVVGAIMYKPSIQMQGVTGEASKLSGAQCEDARVLMGLLAEQNEKVQICLMTEPERQAHFRTLMRRSIY